MAKPANIADLVRPEDEIDEALLNKRTDEQMIDDLKRCRRHLRDEIEGLLHRDEGGKPPRLH